MNTLLYIDPGTGSMLFSILIGAAATLFFLAKAAMLKLKVFFSGKKHGVVMDSSKKDYVIYSEGKQYYNTFLPILRAFELHKTPLTFYTSGKDDPVFTEKFDFVRPEFIGEGNMAYAKLNMISASFVLMTTPGLQVYQLKRSKRVSHYSHILHMPNDATTYRLFGLDFFDSVLLTGDYQKTDIQFLEKKRGITPKELVTVGCTYLDILSEKIKNVPTEENHPFTVLVSPSWGKVGILMRYGEKLLDPLVESGFRIIVRPHPQSRKVEKAMLDRLETRYKDSKNLVWDYERENIYSMKKADVMISDFSGIIFDYTFLCGKPVIYVKSNMDLRPYDAYDVDRELWQFSVLEKIGHELKEDDFSRIKEVILGLSNDLKIESEREIAKETAWMFRGHSGEKVYEYMTQTVSSLNKASERMAS